MDSGSGGRMRVQAVLADMGLSRGAGAAGTSEGDIAGMGAIGGIEKAVMQAGMSLGKTMGDSMGLASKTEVTRILPYPYATTLRALLVAMTSGSSGLTAAMDTARGAYLEGTLPRDLLSGGGTIMLDVHEVGPDRTEVLAASRISGQMFGWGKGKRALDGLLDKAADLARRF